MSYSELESGYQGLRQNRPGFYVGDDNHVSVISTAAVVVLIATIKSSHAK